MTISRANIVAMVIGCAFFMQNLDGTIVATALPQIALSMNASPVRLNIITTAYLLSLAVFIPVSGWLADRWGSRAVFIGAMALFVLSSALCGWSNSLVELTAARILQGVAGAMVVPVGRLVVLRTVAKADLLKAMAFLTVPSQIGSIVGPVVGGLITTYSSWRWIFLINVPIGAVAMLLAWAFVGDYRASARRPMDWMGFLLTAISLSAILYSLELVGHGSASTWAVPTLFGGLVVGAFAVRHATRTAHPLMSFAPLRIPTFFTNFFGGSLFRVGWGGLPFLLPLLFQVVFGMDALTSGLLVFATAIGSVSIRLIAPAIIGKVGFRNLLVANGIIGGLSMLAFGFFTPSMSTILIFVFLFLGGLFQALQIAALNAIAFADVDEVHMSSAASMGQLMQQLAKAFGVALAALFLHLSMNWRGSSMLSGGDVLFACAGLAVTAAASIPFHFMLAPDSGANVSGHSRKTGRPPDSE